MPVQKSGPHFPSALPDKDRAVSFEHDLADPRAFVDADAVIASVVEHQLVELAAQHLPGLRALV
jgi:hypothetical protein